MPRTPPNPAPAGTPPPRPPFFDRRRLRQITGAESRGLLARMRIRKKLIFLHTGFSLALALVLVLAIRPAINEVVHRAESDEARLLLEALSQGADATRTAAESAGSVERREGTAFDLGLTAETIASATANAGRPISTMSSVLGPAAVVYSPGSSRGESFQLLAVKIPDARSAVTRLYIIIVLALLAVYALVAVALEVLVLPENVYIPIRRMLAADRAVQDGRKDAELIPDAVIPSDELGEIMRSRNDSVVKLRRQEAALADALSRLEQVANDLKRKNHLLETARRNLADADRLASLGMMSAGIAHELNTPLTVLKGLVEKLNTAPDSIDPAQAALMLRVVQRLERLGDSLLDFARARQPMTRLVEVRALVQEAVLLVGLDREAHHAFPVTIINEVPERLNLECDPDRMMQVLVNLIRNAVDAIRGEHSAPGPSVTISAHPSTRDARPWVSLLIQDTGPGIDAAILPHLFEPFVSTRLDSRGTGLGLAVAEGIVREHGGVILARNRTDRSGAELEILLPAPRIQPPADHASPHASPHASTTLTAT